jgi:hypothetical protein
VNPSDDELIQRIRRDLADSYDEEFELELEDRNLDEMAESAVETNTEAYRKSRRIYFRELFRCRVNWSNCRTGWSKPVRKL